MPKTGEEQLIALGAVARPHGIRGEVRVHPFNPSSQLLRRAERVVLRSPDGKERAARVLNARKGPKGLVLMTFEAVKGREGAEEIRNFEVCVPREALPEPEDNEWYHVDLVGLVAVDENGERLGQVAEVLVYPTMDCLRVVSGDEEWEVPIADPWIVSVDTDAKKIVLHGLEEFAPSTEDE